MTVDNTKDELNLHNWLERWIFSAPEEEIKAKFKEVICYLSNEDIAYIFYQLIVKEFPHQQEEIDSLLE